MISKLVLGTNKNSGIPAIVKHNPKIYYIEKTKDSNNFLGASTGFINLTDIVGINSYVLDNAYNGASTLPSNIDMSNIHTIRNYGCRNMCKSTNIASIDLRSLTSVSSYSCQYAFSYCSNLISADLRSLTTVSSYSFEYAFLNCSSLTSVNLNSLTTIPNSYGCEYMFANCTSLTTIALPSLTTISGMYSCNDMFSGCSNLVSVDLSKLVVGYTQSTERVFDNCRSLTSVDLSSWSTINYNNQCQYMFRNCTSLTTLSFPALRILGSYTNQFNSMLSGVTGCTVHFPNNMQNIIGSWSSVQNGFGGTNTTVLWDLPSTYILTGANGTQYERNPKYDTQTALAWRVKDTGSTTAPVIDWTSYYTSGLTDPSVNDTIYSDSTCTTSVTTISSIA